MWTSIEQTGGRRLASGTRGNRLRNRPRGHDVQVWQENSNFGLFQFKATCLAPSSSHSPCTVTGASLRLPSFQFVSLRFFASTTSRLLDSWYNLLSRWKNREGREKFPSPLIRRLFRGVQLSSFSSSPSSSFFVLSRFSLLRLVCELQDPRPSLLLLLSLLSLKSKVCRMRVLRDECKGFL